MMPQAHALRFISGKYQGGEFPLEIEREFVIGRSNELDMVLVEDMVSRKHAKISTLAGDVLITDLGSTNGTFVNGEKIRKTRLKEGDRILIGTSILKVVAASHAEVSTTEAKERLAAVGEAQANQGSSMTGTLEEVPVPDLLQLFSTSKRTGILHVRSSLGYGKVYLRSGNIFYASIDDDHGLGPMKSLFRVIGWHEGAFEFGHLEEGTQFAVELEEPTEALLMETLRQLDEFRRISPELPSPAEVLYIPRPLTPPLSDLKPLELDIFQRVFNHGPMQHVFDLSEATDYETATALLHLINQGYLTRS